MKPQCTIHGRRMLQAPSMTAAVIGLTLMNIAASSQSRVQSEATILDKVRFEVASVKPNKTRGVRSLRSGQGQISFTSVTLQDCIKFAFDLRGSQISGPDSDAFA